MVDQILHIVAFVAARGLLRILQPPPVPGRFVVLALGSSASGTWNGAPLPVDLTAAGAPGCHVSVAIVDTFFQLAQPDGTATFTFAVPNQPSLVGQEVHYQAGAAGSRPSSRNGR